MGDTLLRILIVINFIIATAYSYEKDWSRVTYWMGAVILNIGVLTMK